MEAIAGSNKTKSRTRHIFNAQVFLDSAGVARKIVEFPTKATIFAQGDPARAVKYIQQGGVKLTVINGSGKEAVVAIFNAAPDVPILILGNGNEALARKAVERGAKDYLRAGHLDSYSLPRSLRNAIERKAFEDDRLGMAARCVQSRAHEMLRLDLQ